MPHRGHAGALTISPAGGSALWTGEIMRAKGRSKSNANTKIFFMTKDLRNRIGKWMKIAFEETETNEQEAP